MAAIKLEQLSNWVPHRLVLKSRHAGKKNDNEVAKNPSEWRIAPRRGNFAAYKEKAAR